MPQITFEGQHFLQLLDKGIELLNEALTQEKGILETNKSLHITAFQYYSIAQLQDKLKELHELLPMVYYAVANSSQIFLNAEEFNRIVSPVLKAPGYKSNIV